jgi:hypothetical protein
MFGKFPLLLSSLLVAVACAQQNSPQHILKSGRYTGMDCIDYDITPDDLTDRWCHENTVIVKADSIF